MADFPGVTNDWDLEAIIRGWGGGGSGACAVVQLQQPHPPPPILGFDGFGFGLDESETAGGGINHELKEIYKPFVAQMEQPKIESPRSSQSETTTRTNTTLPCSSSLALIGLEDEAEEPKEVEMKEPIDLDAQDHGQARYTCKRRKSKQRIVRVVHRDVGEDGVAMDKWNWRKYGQKAIKGSPYPRSYYRCSSSGGCHARKHVEQSNDNSQSFIVTYIADHAHPPPTRRHAQAGRRITKFASCSAATTTNNTISTDHKTAPASVTWTISDPSILVQDTGGSNSTDFVDSSGLEVVSTTASFDHDFNSWGFDPFFVST